MLGSNSIVGVGGGVSGSGVDGVLGVDGVTGQHKSAPKVGI